jgi:hypothetical protein
VSIAFWSKFSLVDFNRDFAACLIFIPCTTSPAIFNRVFKASRSRVFVQTKRIVSRMKPTHRYDTKAYHDYYIHQAGKGYPVFAGRRYQRGHDGESFWPRNSTHPVTRPNDFVVLIPCKSEPSTRLRYS